MSTHDSHLGSQRGTVYGVLLNDHATLQRLAPQFDSAPYKAAPKAPVLYIKPRNTFAADGAQVAVPADPGEVRIDATIGLVIGSTATLSHDNFYRPAIRQRDRDGFLPLSTVLQGDASFDLDKAMLNIAINGQAVYTRSFATLVRSAAQLLVDVTEFMRLSPGDVLLLGPGEGSPIARAGDQVTISVPGLGELRHSVVLENLA